MTHRICSEDGADRAEQRMCVCQKQLCLCLKLTYISAFDHCRLLATCTEMLQKQPIPLMTVTRT